MCIERGWDARAVGRAWRDRSMAADALTRGGWASGSAKRWHTCHRNGSAEGQPRARVLSRRGAAVEGKRPGTRGSRQCSDRGGGSAHVGKRAEWPAGSGQRRGKGSGHTCGHSTRRLQDCCELAPSGLGGWNFISHSIR